MRRKIFKTSIIAFLLVFLLPGQVFAEEGEGLRVGSDGTVTLVSEYAAREGVSSISFSLSVDSANADKVAFRFNETNARIQDFRYDEENGKLSIYMAGTDALLEKDGGALSIGRIEILDGSGTETGASVSVSAGSLMYVYGTELKWMSELELPGEVQVNASGGTTATPTPLPTPTQAPPQNTPPPGSGSGTSQNPGTAQATPTPVPTVQPTRTPQAAGTPVPVTPSPSQSTPKPSAEPEVPGSQETGDSSQESGSGDIVVPGTQEPEDPSGGVENENAEGIDWVFIIAIMAMVLFVVVAAMAMVVLKKKPKFDGFEDDF